MYQIIRIPCGNVNSYIIKEDNYGVLVDTAGKGYGNKILKACMGIKINLIILTHGHIDHIYNTHFLSDRLNAPIAIKGSDISLSQNNMLNPVYSEGILGELVKRISEKSFRNDIVEPFEPSLLLKDGDKLDKFGISAEIIDLPGHTKGSIGIDVGKTDLLVGDALMNMFFPSLSLIYENKEEMIKSAEKIISLGNRIIHFGHGKPIRTEL